MKNIVLLSDGTGNGAAKKVKTNVWRLYRALDIHQPNQTAFYDDGVGAQEFLPFKILGGAIGWGLKRNVIELYKFLCRNHKPGDKIYLFGFSRGAFTVRIIAGMIDHCGLYTNYKNDEDLHKTARNNYSSFRSNFKHGFLSRIVRALFGLNKNTKTTYKPDIEFIGVWDTVDAYGLPIDELAIIWDRLIFPIRFPNFTLSEKAIKIKKACQALSVDDERHTFHPILWDESDEKDPERIEQVWFSGMHSDVGGGYPKNNLSLVSLDWMISKVETVNSSRSGLQFISEKRKEIRDHADWHGVQHNSRSGLAAYYRYKPRNIDHLCNDKDNHITVKKPKIHRGVLERIKGNAVPYAPTALPASYQVVSTRGSAPNYEQDPIGRTNAQNYALDIIYWRRWLYAALLITTLVLVASRFFLPWEKGGICIGEACLLDPLFEFAIYSLPDFTAGWFEALRQSPKFLWGIIAVFIILYCLKSIAWKATRSKATAAWSVLKGKGNPPKWTPTCTSRIRDAAQSTFRKAVKWISAGSVFILMLYLLFALAGRASFYVRSTLGLLCKNSVSSEKVEKFKVVTLDTSNECYATKILLEQGKTYSFNVTHDSWADGGIPAGPDGFEKSEEPILIKHPYLVPFVLLRRRISEPFFKLMGRIDDAGKEDFIIGSGVKKYKARSNGELFLYVNDAVFGLFPFRYWAWPYFWKYGANTGKAEVTVTLLEHFRTKLNQF